MGGRSVLTVMRGGGGGACRISAAFPSCCDVSFGRLWFSKEERMRSLSGILTNLAIIGAGRERSGAPASGVLGWLQ